MNHPIRHSFLRHTLAFALLTGALSVHAAEPTAPVIATPNVELLAGTKTTLRKGDKLAFFGDSITMQGGYIDLLGKAIKDSPATKELGIEIVRHGLNGGRVPTVLEGKSPWGDLNGTMQEHLANGILTYDGIHLSPQGNALVADAVAKGIVQA